MRQISRAIDLGRLDGITLAYDYSAALAEVDRGYPHAMAPTATSTSEIVGVAMAVNVIRDELVKAHLVFDAAFMLPLLDGNHVAFPLAISLVAHECGHVADLKIRDEAFPGTILQRSYSGFYERLLSPPAEVLWEEYAACRASAVFGEGETPRYEESLVNVLGGARDRANAAIRDYRCHGDIKRVLSEAGNQLCEPLRMIAYLIGHLDGLDQGLNQVPIARDALANSDYRPLADRLTVTLRDLWSRRGKWLSLDEFEPLIRICRDAFAMNGVDLKPNPDGTCHVDIPLTLATTP